MSRITVTAWLEYQQHNLNTMVKDSLNNMDSRSNSNNNSNLTIYYYNNRETKIIIN